MSTYKPKTIILLPDPLFDGDLMVGTYGGSPSLPTQTGPYAGPSAADDDNFGSLFPFNHGKWDESASTPKPSPESLNYQVAHAGSLFGNAEWTWKFESDGADQYRGMDDFRMFSQTHSPPGWDTAPVDEQQCLAIIHSTAYNKVLLFRYRSGSRAFQLATRSVSSSDPAYWDQAHWPTPTGLYGYRNFATAKRPSWTILPYAFGWENPDGSLRFVYPYNPPDAASVSDFSFDVWGSADGGDTWEVIVEDVATKYLGGYRKIKYLNGDSSAGWTRISLYVTDTTTNGLITVVSADGGASWKIITAEPDGNDDTHSTDGYAQYEVSSICGLGTSDGSFLRVRRESATTLRFETATRDNDWSLVTDSLLFYGSAKEASCVMVARGSAYAHVLVVCTDPDSTGEEIAGFDGRVSYMIPLNAVQNPRLSDGTGAWISRGDATDGTPPPSTASTVQSGFMNMGQTAIRPKLCPNAYRWVGDSMALLQACWPHKSTATDYNSYLSLQGLAISYSMVYNRRPVRSRLWGTSEDTTNAYWLPYATTTGAAINVHENCNQWRVEWGGPLYTAKGTSSSTQWTPKTSWWIPAWHNLTNISNTWSPEDYEMAAGSAITDYYYLDKSYTVTPSPPTGYGLGDRSLFSFTMRIDYTSTATLPASSTEMEHPKIGAFIGDVNTLGTAGTFQVSVALTTTEAAVYDCVAGTTLFHSTGNSFTNFTTFRLALGHSQFVGDTGNNVYASFGFGKTFEDTTWTNSGLLTLDNTTISPVGYQWLQLGIGIGGSNTPQSGNGAPGNKIYLKDTLLSRGEDLSNLYYENPWSLRGVPASTFQRAVAQGIHNTWGGGAGYKGDEFDMKIQYQYGADQLQTPSPQSQWRSLGGTAQSIIFDANAVQDNQQFHHSGIALMGTNMREVRVEYDETSGFPSPTGITISATHYDARVAGGSTPVDGLKITPDSNVWRDHELRNMYAEWSDGTATAKQVFRIKDNVGSYIFFSGLTQSMSSYGVGTGHTLHLYADHMMGVFAPTTSQADPSKFMRLVIASGKPVEGYWQIGRMVAGQTMALTVPMSWDHSNSEQGNVDVTTALSGARYAYRAGGARQTITGVVLGDADASRDMYRAAINKLANYSEKPIVLCLDDESPTKSMFYCRYTADTNFSNAGWKYDADRGQWITVGDLAVQFEEEL